VQRSREQQGELLQVQQYKLVYLLLLLLLLLGFICCGVHWF